MNILISVLVGIVIGGYLMFVYLSGKQRYDAGFRTVEEFRTQQARWRSDQNQGNSRPYDREAEPPYNTGGTWRA